jgi:hypothetical protein
MVQRSSLERVIARREFDTPDCAAGLETQCATLSPEWVYNPWVAACGPVVGTLVAGIRMAAKLHRGAFAGMKPVPARITNLQRGKSTP